MVRVAVVAASIDNPYTASARRHIRASENASAVHRSACRGRCRAGCRGGRCRGRGTCRSWRRRCRRGAGAGRGCCGRGCCGRGRARIRRAPNTSSPRMVIRSRQAVGLRDSGRTRGVWESRAARASRRGRGACRGACRGGRCRGRCRGRRAGCRCSARTGRTADAFVPRQMAGNSVTSSFRHSSKASQGEFEEAASASRGRRGRCRGGRFTRA